MEKALTPRQKKILGAIYSAEGAGYDLSHDGAIAFLRGTLGASWATELPFYGCLLSLGGRQGKTAIRGLVQHGYLRQRYDEGSGLYFLYLSEKGIANVPKPPNQREKAPTKHEKPLFIERNPK